MAAVRVNRQPKKFEARYPDVTSFLYRLLPMGRKGRVGRYFTADISPVGKLPVYEEVRHLIPRPVLEDNPEWIELYDAVWESVFTRHMNPPGKYFSSPYIDAALDKKLYQWDMTFIIMYARYIHHIFPAIGALDNFYARQREDGMIWRIFSEKTGREHWWGNYPNAVNPPLFAWTEVEYMKMTGDDSRIKRVLPALEAQSCWLDDSMRSKRSRHKLFWNTGDGTGMDNTPRRGSGWIDLTAQVVLNHKMIAELYRRIGEEGETRRHEGAAELISHACNRFMWDKGDGFYYDIDDGGSLKNIKTAAGFWPLLAGIASPQQAVRLVDHLNDTGSFNSPVPVPALARDQKDYDPGGRYWLGGVWAPTNYMVVRGLSNYGYENEAREISTRYLNAMSLVYRDKKTVYELYAPEPDRDGNFLPGTKKDGKNFCKDDFTGWSGIGPVAMLIENILGIRVQGDEKKIIWNLYRLDRHGIEGLHVCGTKVSLICEKRSGENDVIVIESEVNLTGPGLELEIITGEGSRRLLKLNKGKEKHRIAV